MQVTIEKRMDQMLSVIDFYEAQAGDGNALKQDGGYFLIEKPNGELIGSVRRIILHFLEEEGGFANSAQSLVERGEEFDENTKDVLRDFAANYLRRISCARAKGIHVTPIDITMQLINNDLG